MKKLILILSLILFSSNAFAWGLWTAGIAAGREASDPEACGSGGTWVYPAVGGMSNSGGWDSSIQFDDGYVRLSGEATANGTITRIGVNIASIGTATAIAVTVYAYLTYTGADGKITSLSTGWNDVDVVNQSVNASNLRIAMIPNGTVNINRDDGNNGWYGSAGDTYDDPMDWINPDMAQATAGGNNIAMRICVE